METLINNNEGVMETLINRINNAIIASAGNNVKAISSSMNLEDDLDIDSLGMMDLLTAIEDEFNIMLSNESVESMGPMETVSDVYRAILPLLQAELTA